jgi:anaerobic ribonucleoside-triphosphate reductase
MIYTEEQDRHSHMPDNAPNAPEDRPATLHDLAAVEQRITAAIEASGKQTAEAIATSEARAAEHARDLQTEILRGLESFARGNFARFHTVDARAQAIETNLIDNNTRLAALEERVLYLETRRPPQ